VFFCFFCVFFRRGLVRILRLCGFASLGAAISGAEARKKAGYARFFS